VAPESYNTIKIAFPAPISSNEPYDPEYTYATASATHIIKANSFSAYLTKNLSDSTFISTLIRFTPTSS